MNLPQKKLAPEAVKVWRISSIISSSVGFLVLAVLFYLDHYFSWREWAGWLLTALTLFTAAELIWSMFQPKWLYKSWRFDIDEEFLQLKSGVWQEQHHLVPMTKIQAVSTEKGPLLRKFGLNSIMIETMGSSHTIPALPEKEAIEIRNKIAHFAKIKEVEQ
ncbi:PH domain-containing protein [Rossellomorea vietnamensis]|uniref:PH domain-containing protein n=1 Tax=Rossellomorea vietnamensis TaxID=218284 RepID=A0A5D4NUP9_9BACI|nr:PH domain-containing protein [Rossellomorea vietnamensis]TYS17056.1 PH domain-containing protein [Rossellomorea vietnamensis]